VSDESIDGLVEYDDERHGWVEHSDPNMPGGEGREDVFLPDTPGDVDPASQAVELPDDIFGTGSSERNDPSEWNVFEDGQGLGTHLLEDAAREDERINTDDDPIGFVSGDDQLIDL
jgi:hypothetical protein